MIARCSRLSAPCRSAPRRGSRPDAPANHWTPALFVDEFHTLREHLDIDAYHVLGQSWGGMLGAEIAVRRPQGLRGLMISPASMPLWTSEAARLRADLPAPTRSALDRHEADGTTDHPDYLAATQVFYERHVCRVVPTPQDFVDSERQMLADPTVYHTMHGPNEFHAVGTLRDWSVKPPRHRAMKKPLPPSETVGGAFSKRALNWLLS